jgi:hypothetical protein
LYGELGIPAIIEMDGKRPEPKLFQSKQYARAVYSATHAGDAVVLLSSTVRTYPRHQVLEMSSPVFSSLNLRRNSRQTMGAVITSAFGIELYVRIRRIHHASGADPISTSAGRYRRMVDAER